MKEERYFVIKGPISPEDWRVRDVFGVEFDEGFPSEEEAGARCLFLNRVADCLSGASKMANLVDRNSLIH